MKTTMNNNYVLIKKITEIETEVFYTNTFAEAEALRAREMFRRAAEEGDVDSEWIIASVQELPVSKTERRLFKWLDAFRDRFCGA